MKQDKSTNKLAREAYYRLLDCVRDLSYEYDFSDADIRYTSGLFTNLYVQLGMQPSPLPPHKLGRIVYGTESDPAIKAIREHDRDL